MDFMKLPSSLIYSTLNIRNQTEYIYIKQLFYKEVCTKAVFLLLTIVQSSFRRKTRPAFLLNSNFSPLYRKSKDSSLMRKNDFLGREVRESRRKSVKLKEGKLSVEGSQDVLNKKFFFAKFQKIPPTSYDFLRLPLTS